MAENLKVYEVGGNGRDGPGPDGRMQLKRDASERANHWAAMAGVESLRDQRSKQETGDKEGRKGRMKCYSVEAVDGVRR